MKLLTMIFPAGLDIIFSRFGRSEDWTKASVDLWQNYTQLFYLAEECALVNTEITCCSRTIIIIPFKSGNDGLRFHFVDSCFHTD